MSNPAIDALKQLLLSRPIRHIAVVNNERWAIVFPPTNKDLERAVVRSFPEARWVRNTRTFDTNVIDYWAIEQQDGIETRLQAFAETYKFQPTALAGKKIERALASSTAARELASRIEPSKEIVVPDLKLPLRPYQAAALEYAEDRNAIYVMDEMGLGKTPTAIAWMHRNLLYPALVVCPANARTNWAEEYAKFLGDAVEVQVLPAKPKGVTLQAFDRSVFIVSYNAIHDWLGTFRGIGWRSVICDEFHYCRRPAARRTKATLAIMQEIPQRMALSGTPQERNAGDFKSQLYGLGVLDLFKGYVSLEGRGTAADDLAFNRRLAEVCAIRRKKSQVDAQLPELSVRWTALDLEDTTLHKYRRLEDEMLRGLEGAPDIPLGTLRRLVGESKVDGILEWLEPLWAGDAVPIIFAYHHTVMSGIQAALEEKGLKVARFDGTMTSNQKDAAVRRFRGGEVRVLVAQIGAAGVALNLQRADTVVFTELDWLPTVHDQALSRAHRSGSEHERVEVTYLWSPRTIDEDLRSVLTRRGLEIGVVTDGDVGAAAVLQRMRERRSS